MPEYGSNIREILINGSPVIKISRLTVDTFATGSGLNFVENETPTGTINGVNNGFTLVNSPVVGANGKTSLQLYSDNVRVPTSAFTIVGTTLTITNGAYTPNATLNANYRW